MTFETKSGNKTIMSFNDLGEGGNWEHLQKKVKMIKGFQQFLRKNHLYPGNALIWTKLNCFGFVKT